MMRTDPANEIFGVRINVWTAALVFLAALVYFVRVRGPQEYVVPVGGAMVTGTGPNELVGPEQPKSDVSQLDLTRRSATTATAAPEGYRVVTEEQFLAYGRTGELPVDRDAPTASAQPEESTGSAQPEESSGSDEHSGATSGTADREH